jgi:hypothetical protein
LLSDFVEAVGALEQVVRKLEVRRALGGQQAAAAGLLRFDGLLGNRFLGSAGPGFPGRGGLIALTADRAGFCPGPAIGYCRPVPGDATGSGR